MKREDVEKLVRLKNDAPYSYRCSSLWYEIAGKYGIPFGATDDVRDGFLEKEIEGSHDKAGVGAAV